uniref:Orf77 n=1 Tax=Pseudo-nitzschia multiseries TaxID=37319 RepID=A0A0G3F4I9_PSEMU|nr:orf77 [Pseudo-nitzschia multiseries]AKJ77336.1 orf77 [Pseudo-nitzschia multiseries]
MNLLGIWAGYTILVSVFQKLSLLDYLLLNISILWFTYILNLIKPSQIPLNTIILILSLPNFIIFYIVFIYGSFLQVV